MQKIYLAGAMQAYEGTNKAKAWRDECKDWFEKHTDFNVVSPTDYYGYGENCHKTEKEVMRFDLYKVKECDLVLVNLDNIRNSIGTSDEILYAYILGKPVIGFIESNRELNETEISNMIHSWKYEQISRIETDVDAMYKALDYISNYYG